MMNPDALRKELVSLSFSWLLTRLKDKDTGKAVKDKIAMLVSSKNFPQQIETDALPNNINIKVITNATGKQADQGDRVSSPRSTVQSVVCNPEI